MFDENGYTYNSSNTFKYKTFIEDYDAIDNYKLYNWNVRKLENKNVGL